MASLICPRCNNLRFSSTGASIEINIPKWRQTREARSDPSDLADWHLAEAQEERSAGCSSCQLLWNGVEAVLGRDFHVRYVSLGHQMARRFKSAAPPTHEAFLGAFVLVY